MAKIKKHSAKWDGLSNDTRFFILTGGRGSGKSFEVGRFASLLSFEEMHKILFTRQTMTSAHLSIIPEFQEKIDLLELNGVFDVKRSEIVNTTSNSEIIFKGLKTSSGDQTASLKSLQGVTTWILDEAEELNDEKIFDKINLSIRQKGVQNRVILILNPSTKEHWIYKRFFEQSGVKEGFTGVKGNVTYIHSTYLDNIDNLDESFLHEVARIKQHNPKKYKHVILGVDYLDAVIYPLIAYIRQFFYDSTPANDISTEESVNIAYNVGKTNGIGFDELKPAIKLSLIIEAISVKYGFNFSGSFFDSELFKGIYINLNKTTDVLSNGFINSTN